METLKALSLIRFESLSLWQAFERYLEKNADSQDSGLAANFGIVKKTGKTYYSSLDPFLILQKLCFHFDQIAKPSIQWGDFCLVNENGKGNSDTPKARALTQSNTRCWYNVSVSCRVSDFSRAF